MKYILFLGIISIFQTSVVFPQDSLQIPRIVENVCPFEGCQFGQWIIEDTIKVFENEGDTTSTKFILTPDDTITSISGNIHYVNFGEVLITETFDNFIANDTLIILRCSEGEFTAYYKGEYIFTDIFWPMKYYDSEDDGEIYDKSRHKGILLKRPNFNWWVKIIFNNDEGWLKLKNLTPYCFRIKERIRNMDALE
jgi:hypothetical protein